MCVCIHTHLNVEKLGEKLNPNQHWDKWWAKLFHVKKVHFSWDEEGSLWTTASKLCLELFFNRKKKIQPWSRGWGDFTICPISGESPLWVLVPHPRASVLGHVCSTVQEQEITKGVFPTNKHFCSLFLALSSPSPKICLGLFILSKTHLHPISICRSRQILFNFIFLLEKINYLELFNVLLWDRFFHFSNLIP